LIRESETSILIVNRVALYRYDLRSRASTRVRSFVTNSASAALRDSILWIGFHSGDLLRYDIVSGTDTFIPLRKMATPPSRTVSATPTSIDFYPLPPLIIDSRGLVWYHLPGLGLAIYDHAARRTTVLPAEEIATATTAEMIEDRSGCIWFASPGKDLLRIERHVPRFRTYRLTHGSPARPMPGGNDVRGFLQWDRHQYLVATLSGLHLFDDRTGETRPVPFLPAALAELHHFPVWSLARERSGRLWIGTGGMGLIILDPQTQKFFQISSVPPSTGLLSDRRVRCIDIEDGVRAWIGTWEGLDAIDLRGLDLSDSSSLRIRRYRHDPADAGSLSNNLVFDILRHSMGDTWIATENGLNRFRPGEKTFERFLFHSSDPHTIASSDVRKLFEDRERNLWCGTHGGGLNLLNREKGTFRHYMTNDGLPSNIVYSIEQDAEGRLWLSTHHGLCRFDPSTGSTRRYGRRDGLQHTEFNTAASYRTSGGWMFFGGPEGFNFFRPDRIADLLPPPSVAITQLHVRDVVHPFTAGELILEHDANSLGITFSALSNFAGEANRYRYRLEGVDGDWVESGGRHFASYPKLEPGRYVFRVMAANSEGTWSTDEATLAFVIRSPWWWNAWSQTAYIVVFLLLLYAGVRTMRRNLLAHERYQASIREADLRAQAVEAENKALLAENLRRQEELKRTEELENTYRALTAAHEELQTTQHRLNSVINGAPIVLFALDANGIFTFSEGRGLEKLGMHAGEMVGHSVFDIYRENPEIIDAMQRALQGEEFTVVTSVGESMFETRTSALRDRDGMLTGMIGVSIDITQRKRIEDELRNSQEKISGVLSLASDAFISIDQEQHITLFNQQAEKTFGYRREEVIGKPLSLLLPVHFVEQFEHRSDPGGDPSGTEKNNRNREMAFGRRKDGSEFPIEASISRLTHGDEIIYTVMLRDITELLRTREQLEKLSSAVEQSPAIVIITDTDGIVEYVNPTFSAVSGYDASEIVGKNPRLLKSGVTSPTEYQSLWETIRTGKQWRGELHNLRKDGRPYWVSSSISPLKNQDGIITHYIGIQEDISERKKTEEMLARRNEDLETIDRIVQVVNSELEFEKVIRILLDQGMRLLPQAEKATAFLLDPQANHFTLVDTLGYEEASIIGRTLSRDVLEARYISSAQRLEEGIYILHHHANLPGERTLGDLPHAHSMLILSISIDTRHELDDGYLVFDNMSDASAFGEHDAHKLTRFRQHATSALARAATMQALTQKSMEILRTQEQLVVQEKLASLGRLTAGIAHEIQNPLNFINNFAEVSAELLDELRLAVNDPDERAGILTELRRSIDKVHQHGKRAQGIIRGMMMHARSSSDERERTDVNALLSQAVKLAEHGARSNRAVCDPEIILNLDPALPQLTVVPQEVSRVFLNILENALDAVCEHSQAHWPHPFTPSIVISTRQHASATEIRIRDNGMGIPEDVQPHIFEPFFTTKPPGKGTGLGLSICYEIITQHYRGTLVVESVEGEYTEFIISLPL
ncbi:MAG: PAS domain S-box protein, partial [Bacteroidetes bacterium]|nr:PAS domain S-box protein [Bacteroidota bacterium]